MTYNRPPASIPATPDYILSVIRDEYRQQCRYDPEAEPDVDLTFASTIDDWRNACDLLDWRGVGRALDQRWGLGLSVAAWRAVLEPARERTLRDLCDFIAPGAARPSIEPAKILGTECLPAGAFLAVRSLLSDAGADVAPLRPSTPLDPYLLRHIDVFLGPISRLAPGAVPDVRWSFPPLDWSGIGYGLSLLVFTIGIFQSAVAAAAGAVLVLISLKTIQASAGGRRAVTVEFENLRTFGDLARALVDGSRPADRPERRTGDAG